MAEFVEFRMQEMLPILEKIKQTKLIDGKQFKDMIFKLQEREFKIQRPGRTLEDFMNYFNYLKKLLVILKVQREKLSNFHNTNEIEDRIKAVITSRFGMAARNFQHDLNFWAFQIKFLKDINWFERASDVFTEVTKLHGIKHPHFWVEASIFEWTREPGKGIDKARQFVQLGLREHPNLLILYVQGFDVELRYISHILASQKKKTELLKTDNGKAILEDHILARKFYETAKKECKEDGPKLCLEFLKVTKSLEFAEKLKEEIKMDVIKECGNDELAWDLFAKNCLEGDSGKLTEGTIDQGIEIYEEGLRINQSLRMYDFYLATLKILESRVRNSGPKLKLIQQQAQVFERAHKDLKLSETGYLNWYRFTLDRKDDSCSSPKKTNSTCPPNKLTSKILKAGIEKFPENIHLLSERVKRKINKFEESGDKSVKGLETLIKRVVKQLKKMPISSTPSNNENCIWTHVFLYLVCNLKSTPEMMRRVIESAPPSANELKCLYLKDLSWKDIEQARKFYKEECTSPDVSLEFHMEMAKQEVLTIGSMEGKETIFQRTRVCYETAIQLYGKTSIDLWLTYILFERKHCNDGKAVSVLYSRALKALDSTLKLGTQLEILLKECDMLKGLKHPNIIEMYQSFQTPTVVVLVTECAKESLYSLLRKRGTLSMDRVQQIACHLVSALHYLHSNRILHRDIKPQNVLICENGIAKLCDFGFARKVEFCVYVLTSMRGTPLYMAPEVMDEKPYDQSADLWSFGCILYEISVGKSPYCTSSIHVLKQMVKNDPIEWPQILKGDCLSFLQGLLEKNPKRRLGWPELLDHKFVSDVVIHEITDLTAPLTKALSPSQEVIKEQQREYFENRQILKVCRGRMHKNPGLFAKGPLLSPNNKFLREAVANQNGFTTPCVPGSFALQRFYLQNGERQMDPVWPPQHRPNTVPMIPMATKKTQQLQHNHSWRGATGNEENDKDDSSSCETLTSSSEDEEVISDDGGTIILGDTTTGTGKLQIRNGGGRKEEDLNLELGKINLRDGMTSNNPMKNNLLKSEAFFTLHSFGSEDKPIESDEWVEFLRSTTKEAVQTPNTVFEKHFLTMIVAPLRNHLASTVVVKKIAELLAMPFPNQQKCPDLKKKLETLYLDTKVVPNLLYACKLIARRRRVVANSSSIDMTDIITSLTEEDLDGIEKCLRLICFLVYSGEDFVVQFCDSVCVLQTCIILQIFLNLDKRKPRIAIHSLSILSQVLRAIPTNAFIMEDLLFDGKNEPDDFWRLLEHTNPLILSKCLRFLSYLILYSDRFNEYFVQKKYIKLMLLLRNASSHPDSEVKSSARFAVKILTQVSNNQQQLSPES